MSRQGVGDIRALLSERGLRPKKRLGQHFLADPNIVDRIVALADVGKGDSVVEIGAGTGALTVALAEQALRVVAFEVDEDLRPVLEDVVVDQGNVELRFEDASRHDLGRELDAGPWVMVANLPYNVGTQILLDGLQHASQVRRFVVMVQREVADRLLADSGGKDYGRPSVVVGLYGERRAGFTVSRRVFVPPPRVDSAVVAIDRIAADEAAPEAVRLATIAFNQRRKMLRRSLASVVEDPTGTLEGVGIDPTSRAEDLSPADYLTMAKALR